MQVCLVQETLTLGKSDRRVVIMCGNATIHKSSLERRILEESQIRMIKTPPYSSSLNAAEKVILAINEKMKSMRTKEGKIKQQNLD